MTHMDRLILIGATLPGGVAPRGGPELRPSAPAALLPVKKSRRELGAILRDLRAQPDLSEAFVWDTCQRVEFYGWLRQPHSRRRSALAARVMAALFGDAPGGLVVNRLAGPRAWYHLLRTAAGLNSRLPGDLDVTAQFESAVRFALNLGAAGPRSAQLLATTLQLAATVGNATPWGRFRTAYCQASLAQFQHPGTAHWHLGSHVVIGGSTTSCSILTTLARVYQVPQSRITLVYRGYHGQWKLLRNALGAGRRLRVPAYTDARVLDAIANADFVFLGLGVAGPVLEAAELAGLRDYLARPLTIIDYNTFGSVAGPVEAAGVTYWNAERLDRAIDEYTAALRARPEFLRAARTADRWIRGQCVPVASGTWEPARRAANGG